MAENPTNDNSNDRDPLEEFLKKMQEQGFDPNAEQNGNGTADNPFAFLNGNINPEDMNAMGMSFDPSMLQGIFAQVQSMFTAGASENGINWQGVKDQARQLLATTGEDPAITESLRAATRDASNLADLWLDSVTIFERHNIPVEAWSKAEWLDSSFESWRDMVQPVAAEVTQAMVLPSTEDVPEELAQLLGGTGFLNNIGSMIFGAQMAQALTELAGEVYSSTDIGFPLAPGRSALLPAGYTQLAEDIEVPAQEILLYLAVREAALIRLHRTNPWLREDILELVSRYARGIRVDMNRIQDAASQVDLSNPEAVQDAFDGGLFNPQRTEDQELAVERLEALLALVEGWVSLSRQPKTCPQPRSWRKHWCGVVSKAARPSACSRLWSAWRFALAWCVRHRISGAPMRRSTDMRPAMNCGQRRRLCRPPLSLKTPMPMKHARMSSRLRILTLTPSCRNFWTVVLMKASPTAVNLPLATNLIHNTPRFVIAH